MNLKTLSLIAATALLGVTGVQAQSTGAAAGGTSSNGTAETAARPGPTTSKLTQGNGPSSGSTGRRRRHRSMRHSRRHHHRHHTGGRMHKAGTDKATPKPSSSGQ